MNPQLLHSSALSGDRSADMLSRSAFVSTTAAPLFLSAPHYPRLQSHYHSGSLSKRRPCPVASFSTFKRRLPTILTLARVAAVPLLAGVYLSPAFPLQRPVATAIFILSSLTDFLDGFLARRWNVCTRLGAFLDPVADKLIVCAALVCVVSRLSAPGLSAATVVILVREIFVSALREWMAARGARDDVQVGQMGKVKTATQMGAVVLLLAAKEPRGALSLAGTAFLALSALLAVLSAARYLEAAMPALTGAAD